MREIVLDTETTGLNPLGGHRIVEIGCIELDNHMVTERTYQQHLNPEREMPEEAFAVHGLSDEFLAGQPVFAAIADDFLAFIGDSPLIIHNASFDMGFINAELARTGREAVPMTRAIDTVALARKKFPGAQASLDALCRRFGIDNTARELHGALLDSELLAEVYLQLIGGRQPGLVLSDGARPGGAGDGGPDRRLLENRPAMTATGNARAPRPHQPGAEELAAHAAFIGRLDDPVWGRS